MFEPSRDYTNHPSPAASSIQQPEHVDHEMLTATITTTTNNDDDQQFYQDLLTMERMLPSSSASSLSSSTSSKMVTSIINNDNNNDNSGLNHFNQFQTTTGQQEQSQTNQEYQLETSSNSQQQQCLNSTNTVTGTTSNSHDDFETLMNHQDDGSIVTESFLFKDFDEQTAMIDNHHKQQQQQQHEQHHNHSNLNHADSSSSHSLDYSPKTKMMKSSPPSENMINAKDNQNTDSSSIEPLLTSTTANGHNQHCQNSKDINSANSTATILNTEVLVQQSQQQQQHHHHHEQEHDQSSFDYVDSLMSEYQVDSGVGVDSGNGDSSEACHDFLTNLEVDDPDTKNVVEQFISSANPSLGDASTSLITSSEDILQPTTTEVGANVVNCLVNDSWFQQPSEQNSQATFVESNAESGSTLPTLKAPKSEESSVSETKSSKTTKSTETKMVMMKSESTSNNTLATTNQTKLLVDNTNKKKKSLTKTTNTDNHCSKKQTAAPQSTKNSSTTSQAATIATTTTVLSPTAAYLSLNDHDETPRHTICPLCDNSRSFCSSSSVTRHIRAVHKLTDLTESKYNYCTLCQVFQEDVNAYFQHLQQDHQFDLQRNFSILFTKRTFQTFEEFQAWKEQELETQTGCRYVRCFSYDYPRSVFYKCSGIHLKTLKTQNNTNNTNDPPGPAEPMQPTQQIMIEFSNQAGCKIETADLSKIIAAALNNNNNNNNNNNQDAEINPPAVGLHPSALRIDNQCDARMYPCPSSVRLIFRKNQILVHYIPIHLGHVLNAGVPLPPRTSLTTQPQSTTAAASNNSNTGTTTKPSRASSGVSGKSRNRKASKKKSQNQMIQTTATAKQIPVQSSTPKPATTAKTTASTLPVANTQPHHATQMVAIANPNQLAGLANLQLTASGGGGHQLVGHHPTSKTQLLHLPVVNLVGGNLGNLGNLVLTTAPPTSVGGNNNLENNATTTFHVQIPVSSIGGPVGNNVHQTTTKQANIVQVAANRAGPLQTLKTHFVHTQPVNDVSIQNDTLASIGTATTTTTASGAAYQLNFSTFDGQPQPPTILTSKPQQRPTFIATNTSQQIQLQVRPQQSQPTLIMNNHHSQINCNKNEKNKRAETKTVTYQQPSYHPADSSSSSIDASSVVIGQQTIPVNQMLQNPIMVNTSAATTTTTTTNNNGLVIVSLEKGMEMVQERFRPRKEQLRLVFEQLLNNCLTEADFDLLETSLVSITNNLQLNPSSSTSASSQNHSTLQVIQAPTLAAVSSKPI